MNKYGFVALVYWTPKILPTVILKLTCYFSVNGFLLCLGTGVERSGQPVLERGEKHGSRLPLYARIKTRPEKLLTVQQPVSGVPQVSAVLLCITRRCGNHSTTT